MFHKAAIKLNRNLQCYCYTHFDFTFITLVMKSHFTKTYKEQLMRLGIKYAPEDDKRMKAFDASTSGLILGIWFNTKSMTWNLPEKKNVLLQRDLCKILNESKMSLNQIEVVYGKLNHISQMAPPLKLFVGEILQMMRMILSNI